MRCELSNSNRRQKQQSEQLLRRLKQKKEFNIPIQILACTKKKQSYQWIQRKRAHTNSSKYYGRQYNEIVSKEMSIDVDSKTGKKNQQRRHCNSQTFLKSSSNGSSNNNNKNKQKTKSKEVLSLRENNLNSESNNISQLRNKILSLNTLKTTQILRGRNNFYDRFVKQMNIKLPTPKQKFMQFMMIQPFNRLKNHTQFITHILKNSLQFFGMHPQQIIEGIARKIIVLDKDDIPKNYIIVLNEGIVYYNGKLLEKGQLICRNNFNFEKFSYDGNAISLFGLPFHEYFALVNQYLNTNMKIFKNYIESIQIFQIFSQLTMQKIYSNLTLNFLSKGQYLYQSGYHSNDLFLIYSGSAVRKIIVQIDKTNIIPLQKCKKLLKILSRSYQHRIKFQPTDLVGVGDMINNATYCSQSIVVDENATVLVIDRNAFEENLDEYVLDRLKKYHLRKYPKNYQQLCQNYQKQKLQNRKAEERKIAALRDEISQDSHNMRKKEKIQEIIKIYEKRKKMQESQHLIERRKVERVKNGDGP